MSVDKDMEQEIREALQKATWGPWEVTDLGDIHITKGYQLKDGKHSARWIADMCFEDDQDEDQAFADAHLISNTPEYLKWCLSQITALQEERDHLLDRIEDQRPSTRFKMDAEGHLTPIEGDTV